MKKLFKEFKEFVSKGSVLDLAVGMIIGAAFTAIVSALVDGILKPLINWIPLGETGLQTVLRPAVMAEDGSVLTEALVLDWGSVISAIITFFVTALVLFLIIKAINKAKATGAKVKELTQKGKNEPAAEEAEAPAIEEPVAEEPVVEKKENTEELLKEILEVLKNK